MSTIKKVANMAGVSVATVSYVMNNRPDVSEGTRARVLEVAKKINYTPSRNPSRRRGASSKVTSLAFVCCLPFDPWGDPYYGQFLTGCLKSSHPDIVLQVARLDPDTSSVSALPAVIRERAANGLIVTGWPDEKMFDMLNTQRIPMVLVDTKEVIEGFSHIRPDHSGGTVKAVRHLHSLGHRKIGVITGDMTFACESERLGAYYMAMMQLGLDWKPAWIVKQPELNEQSGFDGMREVIERKLDVTAVICHGDLIAKGAVKTAQEAGLRIPEDISIIGCDNQAWSSETEPPLTTIDVRLTELGQVAVKHLLERIESPNLSPRRITIEPQIVVRDSTGPVQK